MMVRTLILVAVALVIIAFLVWATRISGRPEATAGHVDARDDQVPSTRSEQFYGGSDRPAGPDAEDTAQPGSAIRDHEPPDSEEI